MNKNTEKNILIAFILNLFFSIFEIIGGFLTNSVAILSDSIHDFGDATSIGISWYLEKKSKKKPDKDYTYGYLRYSILGAFITSLILTIGSIFVIIESVKRMFNPVEVNYDGMIIFAVIGLIVNFIASFVTREGKSLNQKSVNLHMLEDLLGWIVVLIGSVLIKITDIKYIDPIMSMLVAIFILLNTLKNLKEINDLVMEKTPKNIGVDSIKDKLLKIENVLDVHHIHIWSLDGINNYATLHVVTNASDKLKIKHNIREEMEKNNIHHTTIEIEEEKEECESEECKNEIEEHHLHHHHNH